MGTAHLGVVGRDDEDVVEGEGTLRPVARSHAGPREQSVDLSGGARRLLGRAPAPSGGEEPLVAELEQLRIGPVGDMTW